MKNRILVLILILYVALNLQACTSFPLSKHPSPTSTNIPTLAPTNTPTVHAQAQEIALSLSGDHAIACGNIMDTGIAPILLDDQCILDALQTKKPFRALRGQTLVDWTDYYWIVGTPAGEIYLIYYEDGWAGPVLPTKQLCENPHISTFEYEEYKTDFLECDQSH